MARVAIVTPAAAGSRTGNRHTAQRWARLLRAPNRSVSVATEWDGAAVDVLIALHARRSAGSIERYRRRHPGGALAVVLTGTDLYRDLPASREARRSLELADRIVVLQAEARLRLERRLRKKTRIVYQSSDASLRREAPRDRFRVAVVGHLREEKDPFRAAAALAHLAREPRVEVVQVGSALSPEMDLEAQRWMAREPRYRWIGGRTHAQALGWIARSHLLVMSSAMEGGANVICEAARLGTPVLASRVPGNLGMLGRGYPGYFALRNERALARLIECAARDAGFRRRLRRALLARRPLFSPRAERRALERLLRELGGA